jgi:hypothetical protein
MSTPHLFCGVPIADLNLTAKERTIVDYLIGKSVLSARDLATRGDRVLFGTWWKKFDAKALQSLGAKLWCHQVRFPRYTPPPEPRVIYRQVATRKTKRPVVQAPARSTFCARIIRVAKKVVS